MPTIAVTGATGFIGGHVLSALAAPYRVRALTRRPQAARADVEWVGGSLEDPSALEALVRGCGGVIHLAGTVKALGRDAFFQVNVRGTERLIDAMRAAAPQARLVLASSLAAREPHLSHYAASKRAAERLVAGAGSLPSWTIVRPPGVYGPGDREILALLKSAARGVLPAPGSTANRVSLIYGRDLADMLTGIAARNDLDGAVVEVDDGRPRGYSYGELAAVLSRVLGRRVRAVVIPPAFVRMAGLIGGVSARIAGRPAMLTGHKARELLHPDWVARPHSRLADVWTSQTGLEAGLAATADWARSQGLL